MNSRRPDATVHFLTSTTAELHVGTDVEEVVAPDSLALRDRVVEEIRQLAASTGEPAHATLVEGTSSWPLVVHPDGTWAESLDAATADPVPAPVSASAPAPAPAVPAPVSAVPPVPATASIPPMPAVPAPPVAPVTSAVPAAPAAPAAPATSAVPAEQRREPAASVPPQRRDPATLPLPEPRETPVTAADRRDPGKPTVQDLLESRGGTSRTRAASGWQGAVRRATGGLVSPAPGRAERDRLDRQKRVQRRLDAPRTIVVLNPKGGAHKTTSTLLLAATFGTVRGGATLAWDNNETRGTLGWRAQNTPHHRTAVDLLEDIDEFWNPSGSSLAALDTYVRTQVDARFDVLASDEDAAASSTIDSAAFDRLHSLLRRYYRLMIVDTGNNMRASNWVASVAAADQLVIVSTVREDTAASAAWLLDGLREKGFGDKIDDAVTVLTAPSSRPDRRLEARLSRHFEQVTSAVVNAPFDPSLVDGGPIDFDALAPETRDAWLTVAATVADRL